MAQGNDLSGLVQQFVSQIQSHIIEQVEAEIAGKIDAFRASLLGGGSAQARPGAAVRTDARKFAASKPAGFSAELKPCPICHTPNKARRFSYLCEKHRTSDNLAKFKGGAKSGAITVSAPKAAAKAAPSKPAPAKAAKPAMPKAAPSKSAPSPKPAGKRGPGRPKGSKNKPKSDHKQSAAPSSSPAATPA
jgi:hypothetical protein